ncbi:MAG: hypothetical protein PHD49_02650 [Candidatus Shapirobacteria bacterium]|nr:hypothetical protein [Candidatus Shapirobacteria bacterium]
MSFITGRLDNSEIIEKLIAANYPTGFKMTKIKAQEMVEMFWRMDAYNSLISREIYLNYLIEFIRDKKRVPDSRFDFLNYVFDKLIPDNLLLEKLDDLAINMEYFQANEIHKDRFLWLSKEDGVVEDEINYLYSQKIIEDRPDQKDKKILKTGFYHHIIQEFLAAKNFLRTEPIKKLDFLAIVKKDKFEAINPSWYGVIRFLLETDTRDLVLEWLLNFSKSHKDTVDEYFSNAITSIESNLLKNETKTEIFELIFQSYWDKTIWISNWSIEQLSKYASKEQILSLEEKINIKGTRTENIVRWGNILEILEGVFEFRKEILTKESLIFWKAKLIELIKNDDKENGVLKRKSLDVLAYYKDPNLIPELKEICFSHSDSLVKEAFVRFCGNTDPNNHESIKAVVDGINKHGIDIYGRYALYKITSKTGIKELLNFFATEVSFLSEFLDKESIFNKEKDPRDEIIIKRIRKYFDKDISKLLKNIIALAFSENRYYRFNESYFIKKLAEIISDKEKRYLFELLENLKNSGENKSELLYNYVDLMAWIIQKEDLRKFFTEIKEIDNDSDRFANMTVWRVGWYRKDDGVKIKDEAVRLQLIEDIKQEKVVEDPVDSKYKEFKKLLEPGDNRYFPTVFEYYNQNQKELESKVSKEELTRLKNLAVDEILEKAKPQKVKVKINTFGVDGAKNYNITDYVKYYGDAMRTTQKLNPDKLKKYYQDFIDFIPFAYSDDRVTVGEIVGKVDSSKLERINKIYLDKNDDTGYLLPSAYVEFVQFNLKKKTDKNEVVKVLKSFIGDSKVSGYDQRHALKVLGKFIKKTKEEKKYCESIFTDGVKSEDETKRNLAEIANRILIRRFGDEVSIDWRIDRIKGKKEEIEGLTIPTGVVHEVGPAENETNDFYFAGPIMKLKNPKYLDKLISLLDLSVERLNTNERQKVWPFVNYLWNIFFGYLGNIELDSRLEAIEKTKKWLRKNQNIEDINWLNTKIEDVQKKYLQEIAGTIPYNSIMGVFK